MISNDLWNQKWESCIYVILFHLRNSFLSVKNQKAGIQRSSRNVRYTNWHLRAPEPQVCRRIEIVRTVAWFFVIYTWCLFNVSVF